MANPFASVVGQRRAQALLGRVSTDVVALGPWPRGVINSRDMLGPYRDQLDTLPQGALSYARNLDVLSDGSLVARRGFQYQTDGPARIATSSLTNVQLPVILGVFNGRALVCIYPSGAVTTFNLYWVSLDAASGAVTVTSAGTITATVAFTPIAAVLYNDRIYVTSNNSGQAIYQSHTGFTTGGFTAYTWDLINNTGVGQYVTVIKDRLFISNLYRVYYSAATDFTTWVAPNGGFFDVGPSDGGIISAFIYNESALYIFKTTGVWLFTFTTDPAVDGYLRKISDTSFSDALYYNGIIYAVNREGLWEIGGTALRKISDLINTEFDESTSITRVGDLLIFGTNDYPVLPIATNFDDPPWRLDQNGWLVYNTKLGNWTYYDTWLFNTKNVSSIIQLTSVPPFSAQHKSIEIYNGSYRLNLMPMWYKDRATNNFIAGFVTAQARRDNYYDSSVTSLPIDYRPYNSANPWTKPAYLFQTKSLKLADDRFFKIMYPRLSWVYLPSAEPGGTITQVRLTRTAKSGEATNTLGGRAEFLPAVGIDFPIDKTTNLTPYATVEGGTPPPGLSIRQKTLSTTAQFYQIEYSSNTNTYFGALRMRVKNLSLKLSFPGGEWNNAAGKISE